MFASVHDCVSEKAEAKVLCEIFHLIAQNEIIGAGLKGAGRVVVRHDESIAI